MSFLPGMFPAIAIAGAVPGVQLAFVTSVTQYRNGQTQGGSSITTMASIEAGDLLVLHDAIAGLNASTYTSVTPSGFTSIDSLLYSNTQTVRTNLSYKIATGSEDSSALTVMAALNGERSAFRELLQFRADTPITGVTVSDLNSEGTASAPASQVKNAAAEGTPVLIIAAYMDATATPGGAGDVSSRGMSPAKDAEITSEDSSYTAYKIYNASPADVTVSSADDGNMNTLQSFYMTFSF